MPNKSQVLCILGPTASGKTALALALADALPCDLISVDSAMVYRGMDIGAAKPDAITLQKYPHALIDICDPATPYSAAQFRSDAIACIEKSLSKQRLPVLVGGSMLYHHVLQQGIAELPKANAEVREILEKKAKKDGFDSLHHDLLKVDPVAANRIHPNDPQRILRALEVFYISGKTLSSYWENQITRPLPYSFINIGVEIERAVVRQRIAERFQQMLHQGFIDEVRLLYQRSDLHPNLPSIKSVGYQQAWQYLDKKISYEQMIDQTIHATRQFAKRQITWLRRWPELTWMQPNSPHYLDTIKRVLT